MTDKKYFIDDRVIIPKEIKTLTNKEIDTQIEKLEMENTVKKQKQTLNRTQKKENTSNEKNIMI